MNEAHAFHAPPLEPERLDPIPAEVRPSPASEDPALLTRVLRVVGGLLLTASASTFMLQRWQGGNDLLRYAMLLAHAVLLAVAAYFCGVAVRESRGARTFLALLLAVVSASFAVLGGLVYSQFRWDPVAIDVPSSVTWVAPNAVLALAACAVTLVVAAPLCWIAFLALARREARLLTVVFLGGNLAILLPVRNPDLVAVLVGLVAGGALLLDVARLHTKSSMGTLEGRLARITLVVPALLMAGRCLHLYHPTLLFFGIVGLTLGYALYTWSRRVESPGNADEALLLASAGLALLGWTCCALHVHDTLHLAPSAKIPLVVLPGAALLFRYSLASRRSGSSYRLVASLVAFGMVSINLLVFPEWLSSLSVLVVGVALLAHGAAIRNRPALVSGAGSLLFGLAYHMRFAIEFEGAAWVVLSALGVGLILAASYVERNRGRFVSYLRRIHGRGADAA
jgi:hypothetical protein